MAAAAVAGLPCPGCAGGGEVNGVPCRSCAGKGRTGIKPKRRRWRGRGWPGWLASRPVLALVRWSRSVPGVAGAACVTLGVAMIVHVSWNWVPFAAPALVVGGAFGLLADRQL